MILSQKLRYFFSYTLTLFGIMALLGLVLYVCLTFLADANFLRGFEENIYHIKKHVIVYALIIAAIYALFVSSHVFVLSWVQNKVYRWIASISILVIGTPIGIFSCLLYLKYNRYLLLMERIEPDSARAILMRDQAFEFTLKWSTSGFKDELRILRDFFPFNIIIYSIILLITYYLLTRIANLTALYKPDGTEHLVDLTND
ncbi:MAG: hypothetical protein GY810_03895 [Aureispira sp.]|nr:hypothetical protein [Aureispira sp.]